MTRLAGLLIPGLWQVLNDRIRRGLIQFGVFALSLNAALVWPLVIGSGSVWRYAAAGLAFAAWLASTWDILRSRRHSAGGRA